MQHRVSRPGGVILSIGAAFEQLLHEPVHLPDFATAGRRHAEVLQLPSLWLQVPTAFNGLHRVSGWRL